MAQLIVRNIEDDVVRALKERAVRHGRSAEAEHRELLREILLAKPAPDAKEVLLEMPNVGDDSDFARRRELTESAEL